MARSRSISRSVYELLTNEEDARVCSEISEEACRETPRSFVLILVAQFLTKLGDALVSPKTVLAWVMSSVQAPVGLIGFLVPVRESGSLIPQLVIASWVRRLPVRKWVWISGAVMQALALIGIGLAALWLTGAPAGWTIIGLLAAFSLARGLSSVAAKDVLGKTVPKTRRGQLTGWSASAAGLVTVVAGVVLAAPALADRPVGFYGLLLACAGLLWLAAAAVYAWIREFPGETAGGGNALTEAWRRLAGLRGDRPFWRFVASRALLLCSALSAPFYVVLARERLGESGVLLGLFVAASGLASLLSAPVWGRMADRSSRRVMEAGGALAAGMGLLVVTADRFLPTVAGSIWFIPAAYFMLSVAHDGVRVGRKTYVVDLASGNRRTDYVSVSNTVIGLVLLAAGFAGTLAAVISVSGVILVLSLMGLGGAVLAASLPEVE